MSLRWLKVQMAWSYSWDLDFVERIYHKAPPLNTVPAPVICRVICLVVLLSAQTLDHVDPPFHHGQEIGILFLNY